MNINKTVKNVVKFTVKELKDKGLISLYIAGTILSKKERTKYSDIDLFGIVSSDFDFREEDKINKKFKKLEKKLCNGIETRFRGVGIDELQGGKQRGLIVKFMKPGRLVKRFPFFKQVYGRKFNFKKDFIKPMKLKPEAEYLIKIINKGIKDLRNKKEKFPFRDFPKHAIGLVMVEAQLFYNYKFDPSRKKLLKHLKKERKHIMHKAMKLREKKASRKEIIKFCDEVGDYIKDLEKRLK